MKRLLGQDILARVEGHGSIELIKQGERVVDARFHLYESPRFFEKLLLGRGYDEVADIVCRVCSICSTAHKVASLTAMENALDVRISTQTEIMRKLALLGGIIESHALHLICLALPDYRGVAGFPALARSIPGELAAGLAIKSCGNLLQETVGGRAIHPFNLLPGGLGRTPSMQQLQLLAESLAALEEPLSLLTTLCSDLPPLIPPIPAVASAAVDATGRALITSTGETVPADMLVGWLQQREVTYSHALFSTFDGNRVYQVGPLARQKLTGKMDASASVTDSPFARLMELHQAVDDARGVIEVCLMDGVSDEKPVIVEPCEGEGIALVEAPRGTLIHQYAFDARGLCVAATIVTPTAINQGAIQESLTALIREMKDRSDPEIRNAAEHLVRLFDPCISCAVH